MKSLDGVNKKNDVNNTVSEAPEKNVKTESEKIDFSKVKVEPLFEEFVDFDTFSKSDFRAVKVKMTFKHTSPSASLTVRP